MIRSRHILVGAALALALIGSADARQYKNSGAPTESIGVVPEVNDQAVSDANPLPVKIIGGSGGGGGGDASAANQQAEIASLGTDGGSPPTIAGTGIRGWLRAIYEKLTGTVAVSATSLPLPSGAATASNQATANTSLASIDSKTPALVNGRQPVDTGTTPATQTTTGALQPPTAAAGKIVATSASLSANTSTQLVAANDQRIAVEIQCDGTAIVGISRTGATLTNAAASPLVIPTGAYPLYTMPVATLTAITAYTGTAQTCRVTEYLR